MSEEKIIPLDQIKEGPVRHEQLPPELLTRIKTVYDRVRDGTTMTLETFEIGFMRDVTPEREVRVWEGIAGRYRAAIGMRLVAPTKNERQKLLADIIMDSMQ